MQKHRIVIILFILLILPESVYSQNKGEEFYGKLLIAAFLGPCYGLALIPIIMNFWNRGKDQINSGLSFIISASSIIILYAWIGDLLDFFFWASLPFWIAVISGILFDYIHYNSIKDYNDY